MSDEATEDLERIGDRLRPDRSILPVKRPGLLQACSSFVGAAIVMCVTLCLSCTSCRPGFFGEATQQTEGNSMNKLAGGLGAGVSIPHSDHVTDVNGNLLRSSAVGDGFQIEWSTPQARGATTEQVLDAVLSRMQNLNRLGLGGVDLTKHIYSVDKVLEEMRKGSFAASESKLHLYRPRPPIGSEPPGATDEVETGGSGLGSVSEEQSAPPPPLQPADTDLSRDRRLD